MPPAPTCACSYGLAAMREILQFIVSLVGSSPLGVHQDLPAHGLDLMATALLAAGAGACRAQGLGLMGRAAAVAIRLLTALATGALELQWQPRSDAAAG